MISNSAYLSVTSWHTPCTRHRRREKKPISKKKKKKIEKFFESIDRFNKKNTLQAPDHTAGIIRTVLKKADSALD